MTQSYSPQNKNKNGQKRQPVFVLEASKTFVELILKKAEMPLKFPGEEQNSLIDSIH